MNPLLVLGLAGAAILAYGYVRTGTTLQDLKPGFKDLSYIKQAGFWQNLTSQKFKLNLFIQNPNKKTVNFQKIVAEVTHNGKEIATITAEKTVPLTGKGTTLLSGITFSVNNFALGTDIWALLTDNKKANLNFNIKGTITADGYPYPIDQNINL